MKTKTSGKFLLDTHIWIWLINGDDQVSKKKFLETIDSAASENNLLLSIMSVWELGMLEQKRRIKLPFSALEWTQKALKAPGLTLAPLTPEIAIESSRFGDNFHGDPADCIILTTAVNYQATLVTCDKKMLAYCQKQNIPTLTV